MPLMMNSVEEIELAVRKLKRGKDYYQNISNMAGHSLLWLKQIFNNIAHFEQIPSCLLTGIIKPIYKGKGKDPLICHSHRGITMTSVIMKVFEYTLLERILPILQDHGHPALTQTAYQKHISCQDAIFATQEIILNSLLEGEVSYLSLYDLEKAFDSIEHSILLQSLFNAGINGKSWRLIRNCYNNLYAVVKCSSTLSHPFPVTRGVQQGSVLSPTFFLMVIDALLLQLKESRCGSSICGLYLGGSAHADDIRAVSNSLTSAEEQGMMISQFSARNGLQLNCEKTEVVKIARTNYHECDQLSLPDAIVQTAPQATCLGYRWSHNLSAKPNVEANISKARRQFFALGSSGVFLGYSNPLTAREIVETCVVPTFLYGAENWILDEPCLNLLENFQAEIGRRILRLSRFHSRLSVLIGLSWPSVTSRILTKKLTFLSRLLSADEDTIATTTFSTLASQYIYNLSLIKQCIFLDSKLHTSCIAEILSDIENAHTRISEVKKTIASSDHNRTLQEACKHQSVTLAKDVNWLRVWEAARDKGPYWTRTTQSFFKILTTPLFGDRTCRLCNCIISSDLFFTHFLDNHLSTLSPSDITSFWSDLRSSDSEPCTGSFHVIKSIVNCFYHHSK